MSKIKFFMAHMKAVHNQPNQGRRFLSSRRILLASMVTGLTVILITLMGVRESQSVGATTDSHPRSVEGTWSVLATLNDQPPSLQLVTFTRDGRVITTEPSDAPLGAPLGESSGHGEWVSIGHRQFALTFIRLLFNERLIFIGTLKARGVATLNEDFDQGTGQLKVDISDPQGNLLFTVDVSTQLTRIVVERVD
jgi:hypothetical protein